MSPILITLESAQRDINDHLLYLAAYSPDAARRFQKRIRETIKVLLFFPELGRMREFQYPELKGIRLFPVKDFEKYLVFYKPYEEGIQIIRVLHSARDIGTIMGL